MEMHYDALPWTVAAHFAHTVSRFPDRTAIRCGEKAISFRSFGAMVSAVTKALRRELGEEKHTVAVIAERSVEMYAAIYGIVCCGCAYLPISPQWPQERIDLMLRDSGAALVLCGTDCVSSGALSLRSILTDVPEEAPLCYACPEDPAYVIYTSGSTGTPKGAVIRNESLINRVRWMHERYPLESDGVILQKTPFTFDVSVWEIFWWGIFGGCMDILPPQDHYYPQRILDRIYEAKVTHIHFVPSMFDLFIRYLEEHPQSAEKLSALKHIFLSGEALSAASVNRFAPFGKGRIALHNLYGPTECTVDVTYYDCRETECDPIPIGRPLDRTSVYVMDDYGNLLPVGVKGELYIGGINVGNGYIHNPELTAKSFLPNPFGAGKLYRTGDLAMWREDGQLLFCGRRDGQVKLNGQRIELAEIEQALLGVPGIANAAVILQKEEGRGCLAAFYTGQFTAPEQFRTHLGRKLPTHMIPTLYCHLNELPLNASGKIARNRLWELRHGQEQIEAPRTPLEQELCHVFSRILRKEHVGRDTNFLHAGGTSLDIMTAIATAESLDGMDVATFISHPTPAALAEYLSGRKERAFQGLHTLYRPSDARGSLILFPFAGGDAGSFAALVAALEKSLPSTALYYVDWSQVSRLDALCSEVETLKTGGHVYFYAHCAGTAMALHLAAKTAPTRLFIGGNTPPGAVIGAISKAFNPWMAVPDPILARILSHTGLSLPDEIHQKELFTRFRRDTSAYFALLRSLKTPISSPCTVFVGDHDPFTPRYQTAGEQWASFFTMPPDTRIIPGADHYFHHNEAVSLAAMLAQHTHDEKMR